MLTSIADGVLVHQSDFLLSNAVVVDGPTGALLIDPGLRDDELGCLADDLTRSGRTVAAGFSTHPHWDHLLWHPRFGSPPRHITAAGAAAVREELADPQAKAHITEHLEPAGLADQVSLDLYGLVTALPAGATRVPWDGPPIRIIEHRAHAPGHAALLIEEREVLIAGDMLSDMLIPMLGPGTTIEDYLAALDLLEPLTAGLVVPGHGTVGADLGVRIARDRAYVLALRAGHDPDDPRIGPRAQPGWEWVSDVHAGQAQRFGKPLGR